MLDQGKNITFILTAKENPIYNWISFSNFYSIKKFYPQAKIVLIADTASTYQMFDWSKKLNNQLVVKKVILNDLEKIKYCLDNKLADFPIVFMQPDVLLIDYFDCSKLREEAKFFYGDDNVWFLNNLNDFKEEKSSELSNSSTNSCFVNIKGNVGNFIYERWINSKECPFAKTTRIKIDKQLVGNENKILDLWKNCNVLFSAIN